MGVFLQRLEDYLDNPDAGSRNLYGSVIFDILNIAGVFGLLNEIVRMARLGHIWAKEVWKEKMWKRAW